MKAVIVGLAPMLVVYLWVELSIQVARKRADIRRTRDPSQYLLAMNAAAGLTPTYCPGRQSPSHPVQTRPALG